MKSHVFGGQKLKLTEKVDFPQNGGIAKVEI